MIVPALAGSLLAGCSGEPSANDILNALNANPKFQLTLALLAGGQGNIDAVKKNGVVEKSECKEAQGAPGYVCDFRWGTKGLDGAVHYGNPMRGRLFKSGDGWSGEF
ncbi:hypothetical protein [Bradyrhizobium sp.]|uniref:hypothetical protein n=1 Tax=Bradyrhizobium sp. TaxID=376 RepID=UPI0039E56BB4